MTGASGPEVAPWIAHILSIPKVAELGVDACSRDIARLLSPLERAETARLIDQTDPETLLRLATRFSLPFDISIEERSPGCWAVVTRTGGCINRQLEAEVEAMPSGRTEDFLARTRFSLEEAFDIYKAFVRQSDAF